MSFFAALAALLLGAEPTLETRGCEPAVVDELRRLLKIEARDRAALVRRVELVCEPTSATVRVEAPGSDGQGAAGREVQRAGLPARDWARLLALAAVELGAEREATTREATQRSPVPEAPPDAPTASEAEAPTLLLVQAGGAWTEASGVRWGGLVALEQGLGVSPWAAVRVDLALDQGVRAVALGRLWVTSASLGARAGPAARLGSAWLSAGLGARLGVAWVRGEPQDPVLAQGGTARGLWAGPLVGGTAAWALGEGPVAKRVRLALSLEGGYVLRRVVGLAETESAGLEGPWGSAVAGASWSF